MLKLPDKIESYVMEHLYNNQEQAPCGHWILESLVGKSGVMTFVEDEE